MTQVPRRAPWLALALGMAVAGCQTGAPASPPRLPAVFEPFFRPCVPGDGAMTVQILEDQNHLGSAEAEWIAREGGGWEIHLTNAVGGAILSVKRQGHSIVTDGPLASKLPRLAVDDEGYLLVDGNQAGVLAGEVPCFLGFMLPREWAGRLSAVESVDGESRVTVWDRHRGIEVSTRGVNGRGRDRVCARLSWSRWLIVRRQVTWCTSASGQPEADLRGVYDYTIKWIRIDES